MSAKRLLALTVCGEGVLILVALTWVWAADLPLVPGTIGIGAGLAGGILTAAGFSLLNYYLLRLAPEAPGIGSLRQIHREVFRPLFARVGVLEIIGISLAAGLGEELLFRGVLQPEVGLISASLLFGALHIGGGRQIAFGVWAAMCGGGLGMLAQVTGGWFAPTVAHVLYDAVALFYIRWGPGLPLADHSKLDQVL